MKKSEKLTPEELAALNAALNKAIAEAWPDLAGADDNEKTETAKA